MACLVHLGFAPCVACKQAGAGCTTGNENAISYHVSMVKAGTLVYNDSCDFLESRKIKPEVRLRYAALEGTGVDNHPAATQPVSESSRLLAEMGGLSRAFGQMQMDIRDIRNDVNQISGDLWRVTGRGMLEVPTFKSQPSLLDKENAPKPSTSSHMDAPAWTAPYTNAYQFPAVPEFLDSELFEVEDWKTDFIEGSSGQGN